MTRTLLSILVLILAAPLGACCVWDRDSLAEEAKAAPELAPLLAGKLERFPARYYELRLLAPRPESPSDEKRLEVYDDLAISLARTGRHDEALKQLREKVDGLAQLAARGFDTDLLQTHSYRARANTAFVLMLRWLKGRNVSDLSDVREARTQLDSLGGKYRSPGDKYLALFCDWIIKGEPAGDTLLPDFLNLRLANKTALIENDQLKRLGLEDAVEGLTGLIRAAPEFECVDVFYQFSLVLAVSGRQSLAHFARLRSFDLVDAGQRSLVPGAPVGAQLKPHLTPRAPQGGAMVETIPLAREVRDAIAADFAALRTWSRDWARRRTEYIETRLGRGAHPDTAADFWKEWVEPPPPPLTSLANPGKNVPEDFPAANDLGRINGIAAPNVAEPGRINIGGLQIHWLGMVGAGVVVLALVAALALALMRKPAQDGASP